MSKKKILKKFKGNPAPTYQIKVDADTTWQSVLETAPVGDGTDTNTAYNLVNFRMTKQTHKKRINSTVYTKTCEIKYKDNGEYDSGESTITYNPSEPGGWDTGDDLTILEDYENNYLSKAKIPVGILDLTQPLVKSDAEYYHGNNSLFLGETDDSGTLQSFYITKVPTGVSNGEKFIGGPYERIDENTYGWSGGQALTHSQYSYTDIKYVRRASSPYDFLGQGYYVPGSETQPAPWDSNIQVNVASNAWASSSTPNAIYGNRFEKRDWYWFLPTIDSLGEYGNSSRNIFREDIDGEEGIVTSENPDFEFGTFVYE